MIARIVFACFALLCLAVPAAQPSRAASADFSGSWDTRTDKDWTYAIELAQDGRDVEGTYVAMDGSTGEIHGTVKGNVLRFDWTQEGGFSGSGQFSMAADGASFTGIYQAEPHPKLEAEFLQGTWAGTRRGGAGFGGVWDTTTDKNWSYVITLIQKGKKVSGTYVVQNGDTGSIEGSIDGKVLEFGWEQEGGFTGTGQFALSKDGKSFSGVYRSDPHESLAPELLQGTWKGKLRQ